MDEYIAHSFCTTADLCIYVGGVMKAINLSTHCTHTTLAGRATKKVLSWFGENRLVVLLVVDNETEWRFCS